MEIKEVTTRKQRKAFVQFPRKLYKGCPHFVPPLDKAELRIIEQHPALEFCTLRMWLAYKDGEIVGRIAGLINHKCNEIKGQRRIRFGWFDVVDDIEVARALFQKVEEWGRSQGLEEICGPSRFSNMEKQSMLVEGFDHTPSICSDYNNPYYPRLVEQLGFEKEVDYIQYKVKVTEVSERMIRLADTLSERYHVHLRHFDHKSQLKDCGKEFFGVLNKSYSHIFNFIPLTEAEIDWAVEDNFKVADVDLSMMLEDDNGRMVGFAFCLPSLSEAFQKANGSLFPLGWYHVLRALKKNKYVDMYLTGVLPEYIHTGVHAIYHKQMHQAFLEKGFEYAFTSQQLENNVAARIWTKYDSEPYFRRRCYKKTIE